MNISKASCMDLISEKFPEFEPIWKSRKLEDELSNEEMCAFTKNNFGITITLSPSWGDTSLAGGMNEFSSYVIALLIQKDSNPSLIEEIFTYIEFLLVNGDEDVQTVAATCFFRKYS